MFYERIDSVAAEPAECAVRRDLALLAASLDTGFLRAGTTLADGIALIDRIIGGLDTIVQAMDERSAGAAAADLAIVAQRITALPAALAIRSSRMTAIAAIAATLRGHIFEIHRSLRVLGIYGVNIKIAASGEERFVGFVDGMNTRLASGEVLVAGVIGKLKDLEDGFASVQQLDRLLAAECGRVIPAVPDRLARDAVALDSHLRGVTALASRVAAIARSMQTKVGMLLGALQIGDSTRQRLEHVVSGLQLVEAHGCSPAAAAHVDRLLAAQLAATEVDFSRETGALVSALRALVPDAQALRELITEQAGEDGRGFLTALSESVAGMDRIIDQFQSAHREAEGMTALIGTTATDLTQRVTALSAIRLDVQDIATNTRLLCRRNASVGRAVAVVASEVDGYARALGTTMDSVEATIARLGGEEVALMQGGAERDLGEVLGGALEVIRTGCQRTEDVVLRGGDDTDRLIALVEAAAMDLGEDLAMTDPIEAAAATLVARAAGYDGVPADEEGPLRLTLDAIARLYTMVQERSVHGAFLLPGMDDATAAPAPAGEEDDDDDGLF